MTIESVAWSQLYRQANAPQERRSFRRATAWRILRFARPHRGPLIGFLVFSVISALLEVANPVLAGRVVNDIVGHSAPRSVVVLAVVIGLVAVLDNGLGIVIRWLSARIGEGLILDLRTAVFDHVQRMPIAFFTRTRTGALVSRLNNDVIGAQRAFSDHAVRRCHQYRHAAAHARRDDPAVLADHAAVADPVAVVHDSGAAHGFADRAHPARGAPSSTPR